MPPRTAGNTRHARTRSMPAREIPTLSGPTEDQIRQRAYEIYVARGAVAGCPDADWRQAEQELRGRFTLLGRS